VGYRPEGGGLAVEEFHSMLNREFEVNIRDTALFLRMNNFYFVEGE
jgi:hypothetical protein